MGVVFGRSPADIEGEAKRTWKTGSQRAFIKLLLRNPWVWSTTRRWPSAHCTMKQQLAKKTSVKRKHARILLDWPGRLMRIY